MNISKNTVVLIKFTLKNGAGETLDKTEDEPLGFIQGSGMLFPKLEAALMGKAANDTLLVTISPEDGFGLRDESAVETLPKEHFQEVDGLKEGIQLEVEGPNGHKIATVTRITEEEVTLDLNHPLAGETLSFDIDIISVREATPEELDHGHVHGEGGHHHD